LEASPQAWQIFWQDLRINASIDPQSQEDPVGHGKCNFILVLKEIEHFMFLHS